MVGMAHLQMEPPRVLVISVLGSARPHRHPSLAPEPAPAPRTPHPAPRTPHRPRVSNSQRRRPAGIQELTYTVTIRTMAFFDRRAGRRQSKTCLALESAETNEATHLLLRSKR